MSASVMCRLESGWPQDDLSARFITLLADRLGCTVGDLLAAPYPEPIDDSQAEAGPDDCRQFGAILHAADRPVPTDALGHALGCDLPRLEAATLGLAQLPEAAGATVVDGGAALAVVDDLAACDRDTFDRAGRTAFALRRSSLPELRVVHQVATAQRVRWAARSGLPVRGAGPALALAVT